MRRRLFTILSALSLVLCVAMGVLWVQSYWIADYYIECTIIHPWNVGFVELSIASTYGSVSIGYIDASDYPKPVGLRCKRMHPQTLLSLRDALPKRWGFGNLYAGQPGQLVWDVWIPHWLPMLAAAVLPAAWIVATRSRKRRLTLGLCRTCGYDLRASKERCPECGTAIPAGAARESAKA